MENQHTIDTADEKIVRHPFPTELGKFRLWADRECGAWPAGLQILAYSVCMGKLSVEEFADEYAKWRVSLIY